MDRLRTGRHWCKRRRFGLGKLFQSIHVLKTIYHSRHHRIKRLLFPVGIINRIPDITNIFLKEANRLISDGDSFQKRVNGEILRERRFWRQNFRICWPCLMSRNSFPVRCRRERQRRTRNWGKEALRRVE